MSSTANNLSHTVIKTLVNAQTVTKTELLQTVHQQTAELMQKMEEDRHRALTEFKAQLAEDRRRDDERQEQRRQEQRLEQEQRRKEQEQRRKEQRLEQEQRRQEQRLEQEQRRKEQEKQHQEQRLEQEKRRQEERLEQEQRRKEQEQRQQQTQALYQAQFTSYQKEARAQTRWLIGMGVTIILGIAAILIKLHS